MLSSILAAVIAVTGLIKFPYVGAISADASSGRVLFSDNADASAYPASLAKIMTALLVLEDVRSGKYRMDDFATATKDVFSSEPTWIGIKPGEKMTVRDLLLSLMVESANDAAIVLAVHSSGSIDRFVGRMNERAASLGMLNTKYYSPSGLPPNARKRYPWKSFNVSTAADQLKLALAFVKHEEAFQITSVKTCNLVKTSFGYRVSIEREVGKSVSETVLAEGEKLVTKFVNHNNVMVKDRLKIINPDGSEAVDGLKTGYIVAGGSSVVLTGKRSGSRAIVVVLGSGPLLDKRGKVLKKGSAVRDENAARLMTDALGSLVW